MQDNELKEKLNELNKAEVARRLDVSPTYLYEAISEKYIMTENFYNRLKKVVKNLLQSWILNSQNGT